MSKEVHERFRALVRRMTYPGLVVQFDHELTYDGREQNWVRVENPSATCNVTGDPAPWKSRKWLLSEHMTDGEVVFTVLKAILTAQEHETRELFKFDGVAVGNSHVNIHRLVEVLKEDDGIVKRA